MGKQMLKFVILFITMMAVVTSAARFGTARTCPAHETYLECGGSCQTECATLGQPCLIRHIRCPDGCYCDEGYARNSRGICIPISECPKN